LYNFAPVVIKALEKADVIKSGKYKLKKAIISI